jgi:hypothetical protein
MAHVMAQDRSPTVVGLVPRAVRLELEPCQIPTLVDELVTRIEAGAGSLREEGQRRHGVVRPEKLAEAAKWLLEYRNLLAALGDREDGGYRRATEPTSIVASMVAADDLVRACAHNAVEQLMATLTRDRAGDRHQLRAANEIACAWLQTLVDLRELDESGPEAILD